MIELRSLSSVEASDIRVRADGWLVSGTQKPTRWTLTVELDVDHAGRAQLDAFIASQGLPPIEWPR